MFLIETPVWIVLSPFVLCVLAAYFCAWFYSNTNDFKKSSRLYFPIGVLVVFVFFFTGLPAVIGVFIVLFGFTALIFFSNRFFYNQ